MNPLQQSLVRVLIATQVAVLELADEDIRISDDNCKNAAMDNIDTCLQVCVKLAKELRGNTK